VLSHNLFPEIVNEVLDLQEKDMDVGAKDPALPWGGI